MKLFYGSLFFLLTGCATQSFFKAPNEFEKKKVILYQCNKPAAAGSLTVHFERLFNGYPPVQNILEFIPEGQTMAENIPVKDIIGYSLDSNYYALKRLYLFSDNSNHLLFVKRLTGENSRIQLYELYESGRGNATGETEYAYFISLPTSGQYETINTHSTQLVPDFDLKMAAFVADCPSLAEKIKNKDDGYFLPFMTFNKFKAKLVLTKIITEYNHCGHD